MTLKRFYQHTHFSLQPPRYAYADLRHEVCGAGIHACVFNLSIYIYIYIYRYRYRYRYIDIDIDIDIDINIDIDIDT